MPEHKKFFCPRCQGGFTKPKQFIRHADQICYCTRTWQCPEKGCDSNFNRSDRFRTHHEFVHGCSEDTSAPKCAHADQVIRYLPSRHALSCGFCGDLFVERQRPFLQHLIQHFQDGQALHGWQMTQEIFGLLQRPDVQPIWEVMCLDQSGAIIVDPSVLELSADEARFYRDLLEDRPDVIKDQLQLRLPGLLNGLIRSHSTQRRSDLSHFEPDMHTNIPSEMPAAPSKSYPHPTTAEKGLASYENTTTSAFGRHDSSGHGDAHFAYGQPPECPHNIIEQEAYRFTSPWEGTLFQSTTMADGGSDHEMALQGISPMLTPNEDATGAELRQTLRGDMEFHSNEITQADPWFGGPSETSHNIWQQDQVHSVHYSEAPFTSEGIRTANDVCFCRAASSSS